MNNNLYPDKVNIPTEFFHACSGGNVKDIVDYVNSKNISILRYASSHANKTPLHISCAFGKINAARTLIEMGCDVNRPDINNETPMTGAIVDGNLAICKMLIDAGAYIHHIDNNGSTYLHIAAATGQNNIIDFLAARGLDVMARNKSLATPLHVATSSVYPASCSAFLALGADKNAKDIDGETPLHWAAKGERTMGCAQTLISAGADPRITNKNGLTALDLANAHLLPMEMTSILKSYADSLNALDAIKSMMLKKSPNAIF